MLFIISVGRPNHCISLFRLKESALSSIRICLACWYTFVFVVQRNPANERIEGHKIVVIFIVMASVLGCA